MMHTGGLDARALSCRRGDRWLFAGVGVALAAGDALWVQGANGAGKTSLLRMLAGVLPPEPGGRVAWEGTVALVDERAALDGGQPLGRALRFWAAVDGVSRADMEAAMAQVGLAGLADVPVRWLSTGQRKRAALARLIGAGAPNWLLDEPLNGLDADGVALVAGLVAARRAAGGTVVIASHQPLDWPDVAVLPIADFVPGAAA